MTKQSPEKVIAPTAEIQTEEKQPEETILTTTTVEESEKPTFQATSSVQQPEIVNEVIEETIVKTEVNRIHLIQSTILH